MADQAKPIIHRHEAAQLLSSHFGGQVPLISLETPGEFALKKAQVPRQLPGQASPQPTDLRQSWVVNLESGGTYRPDGTYFRVEMIVDPRYLRVENPFVVQVQRAVSINGQMFTTVGVVCPLIYTLTQQVLVMEQVVPATGFQRQVLFATRAGVDNPAFVQNIVGHGGSIHILAVNQEPDINRMSSPQILCAAFIDSLDGQRYNRLMSIDDFLFHPDGMDQTGKLAVLMAIQRKLGPFA